VSAGDVSLAGIRAAREQTLIPLAKLQAWKCAAEIVQRAEDDPLNRSTERQFAVVTGASSGIGYELAKQFVQNGFDLLITSGSSDIERVALELQASGAAITPVQANLAEHEGTHALIDAIRAAGRPVDAIALNAGFGLTGAFAETDLAKEMDMIRVNVLSVVHVA